MEADERIDKVYLAVVAQQNIVTMLADIRNGNDSIANVIRWRT